LWAPLCALTLLMVGCAHFTAGPTVTPRVEGAEISAVQAKAKGTDPLHMSTAKQAFVRDCRLLLARLSQQAEATVEEHNNLVDEAEESGCLE
jgi:hypothetical protein